MKQEGLAERTAMQVDFDRIAQLPGADWDHNAHYHDALLRHLPAHLDEAIDVGCGTGTFARLLAARSRRVVGLDLSLQMVEVARVRSAEYPQVHYEVADVMAWNGPAGGADCVASIATLHHLPMVEALQKLKRLLRPGGTLVVLDLRRGQGLLDGMLGLMAMPSSLALRWARTGRFQEPRAVREAWEAHGLGETYPTLAEVRRTCAQVLPGAQVRRHLLWRYSIVWRRAA